MSLRPCSEPGCPTLTNGGRCLEHRREAEAKRGTKHERGYNAAWKRTRAAYLREQPACETFGCIQPATDVHHLDGLGPLGPLGHSFGNLQALCHRHHSLLTASEQPGGWANR